MIILQLVLTGIWNALYDTTWKTLNLVTFRMDTCWMWSPAPTITQSALYPPIARAKVHLVQYRIVFNLSISISYFLSPLFFLTYCFLSISSFFSLFSPLSLSKFSLSSHHVLLFPNANLSLSTQYVKPHSNWYHILCI